MEEDFRKETGEIKELLTQLRICVARLEAGQSSLKESQSSFRDALNIFREERLKTYDIMTRKIEEVEQEVHKVDKKMTYATGIVTAAATFISVIISAVSKKLGLV